MENNRRPNSPRGRPRPAAAAAAVSQPAVRAVAARPASAEPVSVALARIEKPKYQRQDLYAVAEIAYHYLFSGGEEVAYSLLAGLVEAAPKEAYFALALGLAEDKRERPAEAERWYAKAAELDPLEPRADINRAELRIDKKDFNNARALLMRGLKKARARRDVALENKASALLDNLNRREHSR